MDNLKLLKEQLHDLKIMVVDDERLVLESIAEFLKKFFDHVDQAENGQEALELYKQNGEYDIILSDARMPVMNGWKLLRELRSMETKAFLGIMTGSSEEDDSDIALCDVLLPKPIGIQALIGMFQKYLETKK